MSHEECTHAQDQCAIKCRLAHLIEKTRGITILASYFAFQSRIHGGGSADLENELWNRLSMMVEGFCYIFCAMLMKWLVCLLPLVLIVHSVKLPLHPCDWMSRCKHEYTGRMRG